MGSGKEWWKGATDKQIHRMKANTTPLVLLRSPISELIEGANRAGDTDVFLGICDGWERSPGIGMKNDHIYRLRPDWVRPAKKPGMVSYEVETLAFAYTFKPSTSEWPDRYRLSDARDMAGYLGLEFAEFPGRIFGSWPTAYRHKGELYVCAFDFIVADKETLVALTPVKVWFRGEV